jgi:hypothetical protein
MVIASVFRMDRWELGGAPPVFDPDLKQKETRESGAFFSSSHTLKTNQRHRFQTFVVVVF